MDGIEYLSSIDCLDEIQSLFHNVDNHSYDNYFEKIRNDLNNVEFYKEQLYVSQKRIEKLKMKIKESK